MSKEVSTEEMYRLINEAVSLCYNHRDIDVSSDMIAFKARYDTTFSKETQLELFSGDIPSKKEVEKATDFCKLLDEYRIAVDPYNDNDEELSQISYKMILDGINRYRPYITGEAKETLAILETNVKRHLPFYKQHLLIEEYIGRATNVAQLRKEYDKKVRKKQPANKTYESAAENFFKDFLENDEIKALPASAGKMSLYSHVLNIVDCLPSPKYSRTYKYRLKYSLNQSIVNMCDKLGPNYALAKINAQKNIEKYINAIYNAKRKLEEQNTQKGFEARQRRLRDEDKYK